jgi:peptidoglycan/LPS O-acetylase OafA/YrhL
MTIRDALHRAYNLVGVAILALNGLAFFPSFFTEDEGTHKLDEGVLLVLALGSLLWYFTGRNKYSRTLVPLVFTAAALVMKLIAFIVESGDPADQGDEFGALLLFLLALGLLIWQYISMGRMVEKEAIEAAGK